MPYKQLSEAYYETTCDRCGGDRNRPARENTRQVTAWAWAHLPVRRNATVKLVLLALAHAADEALWSSDGYSQTLTDEVMRRTGLTRRAVDEAAEVLQRLGLAQRTRRSHLLPSGISRELAGWRVPEEVLDR